MAILYWFCCCDIQHISLDLCVQSHKTSLLTKVHRHQCCWCLWNVLLNALNIYTQYNVSMTFHRQVLYRRVKLLGCWQTETKKKWKMFESSSVFLAVRQINYSPKAAELIEYYTDIVVDNSGNLNYHILQHMRWSFFFVLISNKTTQKKLYEALQ